MLRPVEKHKIISGHPAKAMAAWADYFFLFQSISCVCIILWIDKARNFSGWMEIAAIPGMFLIIGILSFFLAGFLHSQSAENNKDESFPKKFPLSLFLFASILFVVMLRAVFVMLIPYHDAQILYGREETIEGVVTSFVPDNGENVIFANQLLSDRDTGNEDVKQPDGTARQDSAVRQKKSVLIRTRHGLVSVYCYAEDLQYGDLIRAYVRFLQPSPQRNPGGFDEQAYYDSNGIYLKGSLINGVEPVIIRKASWSIDGIAYAARLKILKIFMKNIPLKEAGLMAGLLLGDRSGMSKEDILCYQKAGLSHITAVSGSAITFLLIPLQAILKNIRIAKRKKSIIIFSVLFFFGFITGWTPSISRALIMVFILMIAKSLHKKIRTTQALFITVTILLAVAPTFALDIGFWFSNIATAGIVMLSMSIEKNISHRNSLSEAFSKTISTSLAAGLSVMPLAIWVSKEISLSSIVSSLLVLPLVEFTTVLGSVEALAGMVNENYFITNLLAIPLKGLLFLIYKIAFFISGIDILRIKANGISIFSIFAVAALVLFLFNKEKKKKRVCLALAFCVLTTGLIHSAIRTAMLPEMRIVFADVGQGDSTLILLKTGESILIDSGGKLKGTDTVSRMFDYYSISAPDIYIATHTHEDHCGGMVNIIRERGGETLLVPFNTVASTNAANSAYAATVTDASNNATSSTAATDESDMGEELLAAACDEKMQIKEIGKGDIITINDQCKMIVYNPENVTAHSASGNESSLIIRIEYKNFKILITGDATGEIEQKLAESNEDISANIYRISHHGSPTSTNHDIISAVSPQISIISVGTNFYGHPSPEVIDRLEAADSKVFRTDRNGAILLEIKEDKMQINAMIA